MPVTPKIILYIACSLDGYIARKNGSVDWLSELEADSEDYGYQKFYASVDALCMGCKTYQQIVGFGEWPYPNKPCYVFSHHHLAIRHPGVVIVQEAPEQFVKSFAEKNNYRIWLVGGSDLTKTFLSHGLLHEIIITYIPVLLGDGIPLFQPEIPERNLKFLRSVEYPRGLVQIHYQLGVP